MKLKEKLSKLINEGEQVKSRNLKQSSSMGGDYIVGEEYENWIAKCIILLESDVTVFNQTLVKKFITASDRAVGNDSGYYDTMMGILKAFNDSIE